MGSPGAVHSESMALVLGSRQSERLIDLGRAAQRNIEGFVADQVGE